MKPINVVVCRNENGKDFIFENAPPKDKGFRVILSKAISVPVNKDDENARVLPPEGIEVLERHRLDIREAIREYLATRKVRM